MSWPLGCSLSVPLLLETPGRRTQWHIYLPVCKAELLFLVLILLTVASKRPILGYCDDNVGLAALQEH